MFSTILLISVSTYIIITVIHYQKVRYWGRQILILGCAGLLLCIFVVMRDDYTAFLQGGAGLIPPALLNLAYNSAAAAVVSLLSSIFIKSQKIPPDNVFRFVGDHRLQVRSN